MTRERFEVIQYEFEQAIKCQAAFGGVESPLFLWGETITALEGAWAEQARLRTAHNIVVVKLDEARAERDAKASELEATIFERDEALKDSKAWVQWAYTLGLKLDWFTPAIGIDNRERIERAVKALQTVTTEREIGSQLLRQAKARCRYYETVVCAILPNPKQCAVSGAEEPVLAVETIVFTELLKQRDEAIMEGLRLTVEKDGKQISIDELRKERDELRQRVQEMEALLRWGRS